MKVSSKEHQIWHQLRIYTVTLQGTAIHGDGRSFFSLKSVATPDYSCRPGSICIAAATMSKAIRQRGGHAAFQEEAEEEEERASPVPTVLFQADRHVHDDGGGAADGVAEAGRNRLLLLLRPSRGSRHPEVRHGEDRHQDIRIRPGQSSQIADAAD